MLVVFVGVQIGNLVFLGVFLGKSELVFFSRGIKSRRRFRSPFRCHPTKLIVFHTARLTIIGI